MPSIARSMGAALVLAVAVLAFTVAVVSPFLPQDIEQPACRVELRADLDAAPLVRVEARDADIHVEAMQRDDVQVHADIRAYARDAAGAAVAQRYADEALETQTQEGLTDIRVGLAELPPGVSLRGEVTVYVPEGNAVTVVSGNGHIDIRGGCGKVAASGINADVIVDSPHGAVDIRTDNGRIALYDAPESAVLETKNGSIYAHMLGGDLKASTTNGYIGANLLGPEVATCVLTSTNGGITLALASACAAQVDAATDRGTVKSDVAAEPALADVGTQAWQGMVRGSAAPDTGEDWPPCQVTMRTRNGNLSIRKGGV